MPSPHPEYPRFSVEDEVFDSPPSVILLGVTTTPSNFENLHSQDWLAANSEPVIAGQAGRTCYAKDLITPLDYIKKSDQHRATTDSVIRSTLEAGHLTTRQHVYYLFGLEGVSRYLSWAILHSYPHYNSEQQSQRYVAMSQEGLLLPQLENHSLNELLHQAGSQLIAGYHQLTQILTPLTKDFYLQRFPARKSIKWESQVNSQSQKRAQEVARYLLPWGMKTNMYHSVSALTLIRYARLKDAYEVNPEASLLIDAMIDAVSAHDPRFLSEISDPLPLEQTPEYHILVSQPSSPASYSLSDEIDTQLAGKTALLDGYPQENTQLAKRLAQAVRLSLNQDITDAQAIALVLDPAQNHLLGSTLGEMTMHQLSQALNQLHFSALVSLSHSADSQLQRHRAFAHTRPVFIPIPRLDSDIVIPQLLAYSEPARDLYLNLQQQNIDYLTQLAQAGVPPSQLNYLQTNATRIRKRIAGPLGGLHHFIKTRTCLNAQEEIYSIALNLAQQLQALSPIIGQHLNQPAPCGLRHKAKTIPYCPEADRFCGLPIWKHHVDNYPQRDI